MKYIGGSPISFLFHDVMMVESRVTDVRRPYEPKLPDHSLDLVQIQWNGESAIRISRYGYLVWTTQEF